MKKMFVKLVCFALVLMTVVGILTSCGNVIDYTNEFENLKGIFNEIESEYNSIIKEFEGSIKLETSNNKSNGLEFEYAEECYDKIKYIDSVLSDRDCLKGENFKLAQKWICWELISAGYSEEDDIEFVPFTFSKYFSKNANLEEELSSAKSYETDGKYYEKNGWSFTEAENGSYIKAIITTENIVVTKKGKTDKQIIVGAHYDGDGTGDNGSGVALALTTAEKIIDVDTMYTIVFIFFSAEEYGCYGSTAYANAMSEEDIAKTIYMINMDSLICGDYTCLYGGVQDDETQTVNDTEAYDNAVKVANTLGIKFETNPWTYENPAPGYDVPDYASPSTGDWSDHKGFKNKGIKYLYFEATNWYIPGPYEEYDGYGETYLIGMLMNTKNDYLEYIEKYFPGRPLEHLKKFSALLNALLTQENLDF